MSSQADRKAECDGSYIVKYNQLHGFEFYILGVNQEDTTIKYYLRKNGNLHTSVYREDSSEGYWKNEQDADIFLETWLEKHNLTGGKS